MFEFLMLYLLPALGAYTIIPFLVGASCVFSILYFPCILIERRFDIAGWIVVTTWTASVCFSVRETSFWLTVILGSLSWGMRLSILLALMYASRQGNFPHIINRGRSIGGGLMVAMVLFFSSVPLDTWKTWNIQLAFAAGGYISWLAADRVAARAERTFRSFGLVEANEKPTNLLKDPRIVGMIVVGAIFSVVGFVFDLSLLGWYTLILLGMLTGSCYGRV